MKIVSPSVEIEQVDGEKLLRNLERYGRICYQSSDKTRSTTESAMSFVKKVIDLGHFSVIEHEKITAIVRCDRGVSHEIVRHRIGSYSQESTRYVRYSDGLEVIAPWMFNDDKPDLYNMWLHAVEEAEDHYVQMLTWGATPEEARSVLPNSVATEIAITYNLREWRHFFNLRGNKRAHPQMREIAVLLFCEMRKIIPVVFDDFQVDEVNLILTTKINPAS